MMSAAVQVVPSKAVYCMTNEVDVPWFARPVYTEEEVEMYPVDCTTTTTTHHHQPNNNKNGFNNKAAAVELPRDPRLWSREEVCSWVLQTCSAHNLPAPNTERFLMNGKAVCLMSLNMFICRVPLGGKLLYRDFQIRLGQAIHN